MRCLYRSHLIMLDVSGLPVGLWRPSAQQADDFVVMVIDGQLSDARDESLGITHCLGAVGRHLEFQRFDGTALPADVQSNDLQFRALRDGDVAYK